MHSVSANYTLPTVLNALKPAASTGIAIPASSKTRTAATTGSSSSSSSSSADGGLGTTFLNLLAQELQNQDPTAPVDSTAMVGQMISLNQLDQLISINQSISGTSTSSTTDKKTAHSSADAAAAISALPSASSSTASPFSTSAAITTPGQLPFDPNTMLPWNFTNSSTGASAITSAINAASPSNSNFDNNASGGK